MISNVEQFQLFLPTTLSQNLTLEDAKIYIFFKNKEHKDESQLTLLSQHRHRIFYISF